MYKLNADIAIYFPICCHTDEVNIHEKTGKMKAAVTIWFNKNIDT